MTVTGTVPSGGGAGVVSVETTGNGTASFVYRPLKGRFVIIGKTVVNLDDPGRKAVEQSDGPMQDGTADWVNGLSMLDGTGELADALGAGLAKFVDALGSASSEAGSQGGFNAGFAVAGETTAHVTKGIYEFASASGKTYVGQSGNIPARLAQHFASGKLLPESLSTVQITEVLGGRTAREIAEQLRINELGGIENLENIRNPIGPARQYLLGP